MRTRRSGFTLVELLVVISIILLTAIISMSVLGTLNGRQITDAARIFTGGLVGARDSAIKSNEPRGIRLLPDPVMTIPAIGSANAGTTQLVYNRYIPIEPAGDYTQGKITIGPQYYSGGTPDLTKFPPLYTAPDGGQYRFPFFESPPTPGALGPNNISQVLMVEESPYLGGYVSLNAQPNSPANWYWNIRVGDKITIGSTGRKYTVIGPCVVNPWTTGVNQGNPEMFVNVGLPGTTPPLVRSYYPNPAGATPATLKPFATTNPEFLFLVNGEDDDLDGYTDEGADGFNQNLPPAPAWDPTRIVNMLTDEPVEWEVEKWVGSLTDGSLQDIPTNPPAGSPSADWIYAHSANPGQDLSYTITRRPVPSAGAREVMLPVGTLIDATTWNSTKERSRIPVTPGSLYCDIMVTAAGAYIPDTPYSSLTSSPVAPFLHFWLTTREDIYPVGTIPASAGYGFSLPMTSAALGLQGGTIVAPTKDGEYYPGTTKLPVLKGDRRLVTMFARSGLVTVNEIESIPPPNAYQPGEGFYVGNASFPFFKAQIGQREVR